MTEFAELDDVLFFASRMGFHVKDAGLVESALARPATRVWGQDAYPGFALKAAALLESMTRNHGLIDGNKRTSWVTLRHFVRINSMRLTLTTGEAFDLVTGVAEGRIDLEDSAGIIEAHLTDLD